MLHVKSRAHFEQSAATAGSPIPTSRVTGEILGISGGAGGPRCGSKSKRALRVINFRDTNMALAPLWKCPKCGRLFANRKQSHFCSRYTLRERLAGKSSAAIALFRDFSKLVKRCGPVRVEPEKTRIAFQVRMSFAAVSLRRDGIVGHVVLARRLENPRFTKIESISPRNHVHFFRFHSREELDGEVLAWLREAYRVGQQRHLSK